MDKTELLKAIEFFSKLSVQEFDVTTEEERAAGKKVVEVEYQFEEARYRTKRLYYDSIDNYSSGVNNPEKIKNFFGTESPVYWLDIGIHRWPKGSGDISFENIIADITDEESFKALLQRIANQTKSGFLQKITSDGRSAQYGAKLETNNHWHDLILWIKATIAQAGKRPSKEYFFHLVFDHTPDGIRTSFHPDLGARKIVIDLEANIKSVQPDMQIEEYIALLKFKPQIILQGPPGTGKTRRAKDIAQKMIWPEADISTNKEEQARKLEGSDQFQIIQFHPAYSYEDFVRGITAKGEGEKISYQTENKVLAEFAEKAREAQPEPGYKEPAYVLIIDEINRANLPAVLGELIYALEYRGDTVQSMYAVKEEEEAKATNDLILPKNLYLIGTMNTADRSVGHIDYAIRRRFAFVEMLPEVLDGSSLGGKRFYGDAFKEVSKLFVKEIKKESIELEASDYLSPEFAERPQDIWLGHSYFIAENEDQFKLRLKYEIIPILEEYVKDGILKDKGANETIKGKLLDLMQKWG